MHVWPAMRSARVVQVDGERVGVQDWAVPK